tara:strand:- start:363 stop:590 length:228 start_codon:yes stop_codon:yes gene_type:complete
MNPSVDDIMNLFDKDHDGKISKEEFRNTLIELAAEQKFECTAGDLARADAEFDKTDTSGDGFVEIGELEAAMKNM